MKIFQDLVSVFSTDMANASPQIQSIQDRNHMKLLIVYFAHPTLSLPVLLKRHTENPAITYTAFLNASHYEIDTELPLLVPGTKKKRFVTCTAT